MIGVKSVAGIILIAFFGFHVSSLLGSLDLEHSNRFVSFVGGFYFLLMMSLCGQLLFTRVWGSRTYYREDSFTKWQARMRMMPISYRSLMVARIVQIIFAAIITGAVYFTVFYWNVDVVFYTSIGDHSLSFGLLWTGFSIIMMALFTYIEFTQSGKVYAWFTYLYFIILTLLILLGEIALQLDLFKHSLHWVKSQPILAPCIIWLIAGGCLWFMYVRIQKRLVRRDLL